MSVTARFAPKTDHVLFKEVEAGVDWQMQFADGAVAKCRTSYAENLNSRLRAEAAKGWMELQPAFGYGGARQNPAPLGPGRPLAFGRFAAYHARNQAVVFLHFGPHHAHHMQHDEAHEQVHRHVVNFGGRVLNFTEEAYVVMVH
ncbi:MAG: glucose-fructose oxidoreductase [Hymenobacter sp.]|nr:glucose-fructose oxidoreductase [Hymenobacter sp.]